MPVTRVTESCNHSHQLTQDVRSFMQQCVAPAITAHNADSTRPSRKRDKAIECVYTRIATWLLTFEKLNAPRDMQAIGTGARCVFEHYLDLRWFERFPDECYMDRYWAFPDVDRYWAAKRAVDHKLATPASRIDVTHRQQFMDRLDAKNKSETIPALVSRLWGTTKDGKPRWPKDHWTGMGNLRERAKALGPGYEDTYVQIYPTLCALVHPGATPYLGDFEWLEVQVGYGYFYTFHHAWEATELTIDLLGIEQHVPQLDAFRFNLMKWLEEAQAAHLPI
jgi:hypothetical protein